MTKTHPDPFMRTRNVGVRCPRQRALLVAAVLLPFIGCAPSSDFKLPATSAGPAYLSAGQPKIVQGANIQGAVEQSIVGGLDIPARWWTVFRSPQINTLIDRAFKANPDIQVATSGLRVAQENARAQRATLFPSIQGAASASTNRTPASLSSAAADGATRYGLFTAGLNVVYALDVWGGLGKQLESLDAIADEQCFQVQGA